MPLSAGMLTKSSSENNGSNHRAFFVPKTYKRGQIDFKQPHMWPHSQAISLFGDDVVTITVFSINTSSIISM